MYSELFLAQALLQAVLFVWLWRIWRHQGLLIALVLLVPQFTLAADTRSGTRPSFTPAASPAIARQLFDYAVDRARTAHPVVETGKFGADMKVALINDGPVTFWLHVPPTHLG